MPYLGDEQQHVDGVQGDVGVACVLVPLLHVGHQSGGDGPQEDDGGACGCEPFIYIYIYIYTYTGIYTVII